MRKNERKNILLTHTRERERERDTHEERVCVLVLCTGIMSWYYDLLLSGWLAANGNPNDPLTAGELRRKKS